MKKRLLLLPVVTGLTIFFAGSGTKADVPLPGNPIWTMGPGPAYGIVELQGSYDTPMLIRYGSHVHDEDINNTVNPPVKDVDRNWMPPMAGAATTPPHYASQRNKVFESANWGGKTGDLLWRMTGGMYPMMNEVDVNIIDNWTQKQSRGVDTANDTPGIQQLEFSASFVVKAQAGKLKVYVNNPNGTPAAGASVQIDGMTHGSTDMNGLFTKNGMLPGPYKVKAVKPPFQPSNVADVTITKGQTATATVTLGPMQMMPPPPM